MQRKEMKPVVSFPSCSTLWQKQLTAGEQERPKCHMLPEHNCLCLCWLSSGQAICYISTHFSESTVKITYKYIYNSSRFKLAMVSGDFAIKTSGPWMVGGREQPLQKWGTEAEERVDNLSSSSIWIRFLWGHLNYR